MRKLFLTTIFIITFQSCFGQFESRIPGMYITGDVGNWGRVLVIKPDSTYFFCIDTDLGGQDYIEPALDKLPTWTFDKINSRIVLSSKNGYEPSIKTLRWDTVSLVSGLNNTLKTWVRIADMDLFGNILTFREGNDYIKFSANYQPLYSEWQNPQEGIMIRNTYFKLTDEEMSSFREKYLKHSSFKGDLYSEIRFIKSMVETFFPVESREEFTAVAK